MRAENDPRPAKLLRVRERIDMPLTRPQASAAKRRKSRFVAPVYLPAETQAAIQALLQQAGIGDRDGRQIFITAAEYEVGTFRSTAVETPTPEPRPAPRPPSQADMELAQIGQAAGEFLVLLRQAGAPARSLLAEHLTTLDPFGRIHDEHYMGQLEVELERIRTAIARHEKPPPEPPPPAVSEGARLLARQLARIFGECLEVKLKAAELETFCQVLCLIRDGAQIALPCEPPVLAQLLGNATEAPELPWAGR
jgi:hypothetical protein